MGALFLISFFVCLFIVTLIEAFSEILYKVKNEQKLEAYLWWIPGVFGGFLFFLLILYIKYNELYH